MYLLMRASLYEQMDVEQAFTDLLKAGSKIKQDVFKGKKTDSDKRRYLGTHLRKIPELANKYPSKIQLACQLVDWAVSKGWQQPFVIDSWFTCKELCQHIEQAQRDWIGSI